MRIAYRASAHELAAKTLDYSRVSIDEQWVVGRDDMQRALDKLEAGESSLNGDGYALYDSGRLDAEMSDARM